MGKGVSRLRDICFHEVGHAVIARAVGASVIEIRIDLNGFDCNGKPAIGQTVWSPGRVNLSPAAKTAIVYAGCCAENPAGCIMMAGGDLDDFKELTKGVAFG